MAMLHQQARDIAFRARLITGLAALGAFLGALAWTHWRIYLNVSPPLALDYLGAIWRALTLPSAAASGLRLELLLSAAAGAAALALPALAVMVKKSTKKGV